MISQRKVVQARLRPPGLKCRPDIVHIENYASAHAQPLYDELGYDRAPADRYTHLSNITSAEYLDQYYSGAAPVTLHTSTILHNHHPVGAIAAYYHRNQLDQGGTIHHSWIGGRHRRKGIMLRAKALFYTEQLRAGAAFIDSTIMADNHPNLGVMRRLKIPPSSTSEESLEFRVTPELAQQLAQDPDSPWAQAEVALRGKQKSSVKPSFRNRVRKWLASS